MLKKIDIKGGKLSYGQRIELGKIIDRNLQPHQMVREVYECLHHKTVEITPLNVKKLIAYAEEILEGIVFWVKKEQELLKYEPTAEEMRAGIKQLSRNIGDYGTIKALAKTYGQDPDTILAWEYGKVFGILYTDLEEHKYQKRLHKVLAGKNSGKTGNY